MNQPKPQQLDRVFKRLSKMNRPGVKGSFRAIAEPHGYHFESLKTLLKGKIKKWKPIHYQMYQESKNYLSKNQQVTQ